MLARLGKCSRIGHIVKLRQMIQRWQNKARISVAWTSPNVPAGHVVVCVGTNCKRFVVRATYLNHPVFQKVLIQAEEEYRFSNQGPLLIPCDESFFEEVIQFISRSESGHPAKLIVLDDIKSNFHVGVQGKLDWFKSKSQLLLPRFAEKTIW